VAGGGLVNGSRKETSRKEGSTQETSRKEGSKEEKVKIPVLLFF
jgi:hypothetical protein